MHFIYLYADSDTEWNCAEWRCLSPSSAINAEHEAGRTKCTAQLFHMPSALDWSHPQVQGKLGRADVLVFQRNAIIPDVWAAMDYWRALGKIVVIDVDDHYPHLPPSNPAHGYWIRNMLELNPPPIEALTEGMRHADALTSPSKVILEDWSHVIRGYWLPNWTRRLWYEPIQQKPIGKADIELGYRQKSDNGIELVSRPSDGSEGWIVIGWGGSISHVDSWLYSGVIEALDRIFEKYPQAHLKFCGHEERLEDTLSRWGDRVIRQSGVRPEHWPLEISTFDIGIAPLDTRPLDPPWREGAPIASYDERRSWLKGVEYLTAGVPWIGSRSLAYNDLAKQGRLVVNTPDAWFAALDEYITDLVIQKRAAWNLRDWALRHLTFEPNVGKYAKTFEHIYATKRQARGRLPGVIYVPKAIKQEATT